tara:strand:+ start:334 stop:540 length:207 start_codon:yes stop_codon:yes gene_type:complete
MKHDKKELTLCLSSVWDVLYMAREDCISEGIDSNDEQWHEVRRAMNKIHKALNIKHEEIFNAIKPEDV